jgi:hypothetical protein
LLENYYYKNFYKIRTYSFENMAYIPFKLKKTISKKRDWHLWQAPTPTSSTHHTQYNPWQPRVDCFSMGTILRLGALPAALGMEKLSGSANHII